jgi:hypothetical protein
MNVCSDLLQWYTVKMQSLRKLTLTNSLLSVLFVVLLLAQTIGMMHRIAHASGSVEHVASEKASFINSLWGDHSKSSDCHAFDQSCPDLFVIAHWQQSLTQSIPEWMVVDSNAAYSNFERFYSAQGPPVSLK